MATPLELAGRLREAFPGLLGDPVEFRGEVTLDVRDPARIADVCLHARDVLGFDFLTDLSSVDNYGDDPRWLVVYELYGMGHGQHLRLRTAVGEEKSEVPTVSGIWRTADWHEREAYDMMGIRFFGASGPAAGSSCGTAIRTTRSARISRWPARRPSFPRLRSPGRRRWRGGPLSRWPPRRIPRSASRRARTPEE